MRTDALDLLNYMGRLGFPEGTRIAMIRPAPDERTAFFADMAKIQQPFVLSYFPTMEAAEVWVRDS